MILNKHHFIVSDWRKLSKNKSVAILGSGGFARSLAIKLKKNGFNPICFSSEKDLPDNYLPLEEIANQGIDTVLLGTDTYQVQMIHRLAKKFPDLALTLIDVNDSLTGSANNCRLLTQAHSLHKPFILLIDPYPHNHIYSHLANLKNYYAKKGIELLAIHPLIDISLYLENPNYRGAIVWNGSTPLFESVVKKLQSHSLGIHFVEVGMFPQSDWFYIDTDGINASSSLAKTDLAWVTDFDYQQLETVRKNFLKTVGKSEPKYVLVPLQLANDANIQSHSNFRNGMQEFIDFIENKYPEQQILIKPHPLDKHRNEYRTRFAELTNETWLSLLPGASLVHGINSTTLFESVLYGVTVKAEGNCLLNIHQDRQEQLLAAIVAKQIAVSDLNPCNTLQRFCHLP